MIYRLLGLLIFLLLFVSCNADMPVQQMDTFENAPNRALLEMEEEVSEPIVLKLAPRPKSGEAEHQCLAETFLFLIGQPKSAIAAIEYPYNTRLFYVNEIRSDNFIGNRLNLILDSSEKIIQVYCG